MDLLHEIIFELIDDFDPAAEETRGSTCMTKTKRMNVKLIERERLTRDSLGLYHHAPARPKTRLFEFLFFPCLLKTNSSPDTSSDTSSAAVNSAVISRQKSSLEARTKHQTKAGRCPLVRTELPTLATPFGVLLSYLLCSLKKSREGQMRYRGHRR